MLPPIPTPVGAHKGQYHTGKWVQKLLTRGLAMWVPFTWTAAPPRHSHPEPARGTSYGPLC